MNKNLILSAAALAASTALVLSGCSTAPASPGTDAEGGASSDVATITPGTLLVAFGPYMPFTGEEDGNVVGLDGDIVNEMAKRLDLDVEIAVTDFPGGLSGVQTGRYDVYIGTVNWKPERTELGYYTDDTYYNPPAVGGPKDETFRTVDDLAGKRICTVTGYAYADVIPEIEGAEAALFPRMEDVVEEFAAGRCGAVFLDPLVVGYTAKQRPDIGLKVNYLEAPTDEQVAERPGLVSLLPAITGVYSANQSLADSLTGALRDMYADGWMDETITEYGGDPDQYLQAEAKIWERRIGVDRDDNWTPPSEVRNTAN